MAIIKNIQLEDEFLRVPNATAKHVETDISLQALGLLANITCYSGTWELHKTELYKRYTKNGRTSVASAWKELEEARYIVEYKYRDGKKWEYVYYVRLLPFTEEEKAKILKVAKEEHGEIFGLETKAVENQDTAKSSNDNDFCTVDSVQSTLDTSKPTDNKDLINERKIKENNILKNDDKETSKTEDKPCVEVDHLDTAFDEVVKSVSKDKGISLHTSTINAVRKRVTLAYVNEKIHADFFAYVETCLVNAHDNYLKGVKERADRKRLKEFVEADKKRKQNQQQDVKRESVPFYNWLEE